MPRIFGPRDYLRDETLGDVAQQAAQINQARFNLEGQEAQRAGFQGTFAPGEDLGAAYTAKGKEDRRNALVSRAIEVGKGVAELGSQYGVDGANAFLAKATEGDEELQELYSDTEVTNVNLDGTFETTDKATEDFEDSAGRQIKKGDSYVQVNDQNGQIVSVNRIDDPGGAGGRGRGAGGTTPTQKSALIDAQIDRLLLLFPGGADVDSMTLVLEAADNPEHPRHDLANQILTKINERRAEGGAVTQKALSRGERRAVSRATGPAGSLEKRGFVTTPKRVPPSTGVDLQGGFSPTGKSTLSRDPGAAEWERFYNVK